MWLLANTLFHVKEKTAAGFTKRSRNLSSVRELKGRSLIVVCLKSATKFFNEVLRCFSRDVRRLYWFDVGLLQIK